VFNNQSCSFYDSPQALLPFLTGTKATQDDLWFLQVPDVPEPQHSPSILFSLQELPHAKFVAYWHRAFGCPSLSTFLHALSSNFIRNIPRLTPALVRKYPPLSLATSYGHLDTLRQGIASTRKPLPSPSVLSAVNSFSPTLSRLDRRRQLFLDDSDDQDGEMHELPSSLAEPSASIRRSTRLTSPTLASSQVRTVHRSKWTASDLTGRFPVPSYKGHEYLLITLHLGYIHYLPIKTRSASSYISAFKKIFAFFTAKSFPIAHLILDNESSTSLTTFLQSQHVSFQHVPPNQHRTNPAERAIRTAKNHFLSVLSAAHISFPPNRWPALLPLTELTLNHLRSFAPDPSISAWHGLHGQPLDFAAHPIHPAG
jgi:hypothetical protein